jgi:hypothetical protein
MKQHHLLKSFWHLMSNVMGERKVKKHNYCVEKKLFHFYVVSSSSFSTFSSLFRVHAVEYVLN